MDKIAILCDFDGTVALDDVGNLLFKTFSEDGSTAEVVDSWRRGEMSSRECLEREAALANVDRPSLDRFLRDRKIDPFFKDFHDFVRKRRMEIAIMSDGLDYYIERILMHNGLGDIDFFANRLVFRDDGVITVEFPHYDLLECRDCGCCKTHHLFRYRDQGYKIVYVGDGLSDRCPSESADVVFAKGDLLAHCRAKNIDHIEFRNFRDVEREVLRLFVLDDDYEA